MADRTGIIQTNVFANKIAHSFMQDNHYVSEFLLKSFTVNGSLQVFSKKTKRIKAKTPGQVCYERGFTTFEKSDVPPGEDENFIEKEFSKWENRIAPIHKHLLVHRSLEAIRPEEFCELVQFAMWLNLCNPAICQMLKKAWSQLQIIRAKNYSKTDLDNLSLKAFGLYITHTHLQRLLDSNAEKDQLFQSNF